MNIINKFTLANINKNKKRTIVTTIGVALSTALICAVAGMIMSFQNTLVEYAKKEYGNYHACYMNIPNDQLKYIRDNVQTKEYFYSKTLGYAKLEGSKNDGKPYVYVLGMDSVALKENGLVLSKGRMPENDTEIIISKHIETTGRVYWNIGDTITLDIGTRQDKTGYVLNQHNPYQPEDFTISTVDGEIKEKYDKSEEEIVNTKRKQYKIVGIIERPNGRLEDFSAPGYTIITYMTDKQIADTSNEPYGTNISVLFKKPTASRDTMNKIGKTLEENTGKTFKVIRNSSLLEAQGGLSEESLQVIYNLRSNNNRNNSCK